MFTGSGTVLNILTIVIGGALGVFIGAKISEKLRNLVTDVLGCVTIISAADALSAYWDVELQESCLLYTSPSPRDKRQSRMPSSA